MRHGDTAQLAAIVGAVGALLVLVPARRVALLGGLVLLALAEAGFALALVPADDRHLLLAEAPGLVLVAAAAVAAAALAWVLVRRPALTPVVILAAAPFRLPVELGDQRAFLLLPLYGVLAGAVLALAYRAARGDELPSPPPLLVVPAAAFTALAGISLLWSSDLRAGSIALGFFYFPFAALVAVVLRSPIAPWTTRALAGTAIGLAVVFGAIGLWQARTRELFFAPDLEVANAYTSFFRVTSLFKDPSLYGRQLVVAIAIVLVGLWIGRIRFWAAAAIVAFLWAALWYSYSQSSLAALFAVVLAVPLVLGDRRTRLALGAAALAFALVGAGIFLRAALNDDSPQSATSGRYRLVEVTAAVVRDHPLAGVGIGAQPIESARQAGNESARRNASHTTPLTVAAELGVPGIMAYLAFLAAVSWALLALVRTDRPLGLGLAATFLVLVLHSFLYSGFFEDPLTWGVVAVAGASLAARGVDLRLPRFLRVPVPAVRLPRRRVVLAVATGVLLLGGALTAFALRPGTPPKGEIDTELEDVSVAAPTVSVDERETVRPPPPKQKRAQRKAALSGPPGDICWRTFGGNAQRTLARTDIHLGRPTKPLWARGMGSYMEYPPSYCDGVLYVNTDRGKTAAVDARTGDVIWARKSAGSKPSTPAIAGPLLIVSSHNGTVTAFLRRNGKRVWQIRTSAKVESSPVALGRIAYFGSTDGRLFAVYARTGRIRWAYDTGGRINASPTLVGNKVCITTYAGTIFCLRRSDGKRIWRRAIRRDTFRYESFYASASTDGRRLFTVARSGRVVALDSRTGRVLWTAQVGGYGYSTPAVANGRVFVGGFDGQLRAFRSTTGRLLWRRWAGGRILAPALVVGNLVFVSSLEKRTFALRTVDGRVVWRFAAGKYAPGIATERHYYFSLNGLLVAFRARFTPPAKTPAARGTAPTPSSERGVATAPKR
jgi:outer membrane protein assembly factor BamB